MNVGEYFSTLVGLFKLIPFNGGDIFFLIIVSIFVYSETKRSFIQSCLLLSISCIIWIFSINFYSLLTPFFPSLGIVDKGSKDVTGVVIITVFITSITFVIYKFILQNIPQEYKERKVTFLSSIFGLVSILLYLSIATSVIVSYPSPKLLKSTLTQSVFFSSLISFVQIGESTIQKIGGRYTVNLLNFSTVAPESKNEQVLQFKSPVGVYEDHQNIIDTVNKKRFAAKKTLIQEDQGLSEIALSLNKKKDQGYTLSQDLNTFDFDIKTNAYNRIYVIPAYAQGDTIAVEGLMQIPEYKHELLDSQYSYIGISELAIKNEGYLFIILLAY